MNNLPTLPSKHLMLTPIKITALVLCAASLCSVAAVAQVPALLPASPVAQAINENYLVTLTMTDKDQKSSELSLVTASADFKTDFPDAQSNVTSLTGTLTPEKDAVLVRYGLASNLSVTVLGGTQYKTLVTQATVRLKLDEPVEILKSNDRTCTLRVSRLSDVQAKGK